MFGGERDGHRHTAEHDDDNHQVRVRVRAVPDHDDDDLPDHDDDDIHDHDDDIHDHDDDLPYHGPLLLVVRPAATRRASSGSGKR